MGTRPPGTQGTTLGLADDLGWVTILVGRNTGNMLAGFTAQGACSTPEGLHCSPTLFRWEASIPAWTRHHLPQHVDTHQPLAPTAFRRFREHGYPERAGHQQQHPAAGRTVYDTTASVMNIDWAGARRWIGIGWDGGGPGRGVPRPTSPSATRHM